MSKIEVPNQCKEFTKEVHQAIKWPLGPQSAEKIKKCNLNNTIPIRTINTLFLIKCPKT